jgi:hypothetical protein
LSERIFTSLILILSSIVGLRFLSAWNYREAGYRGRLSYDLIC